MNVVLPEGCFAPVASLFYLEHIRCAPNLYFQPRGNNNNNIGGLWAYLCFFVRVVSFCIFVVHVYSAVVVFLFLYFFSPGVRPSGGDGVTRVFFIVNAVSRFILGRE